MKKIGIVGGMGWRSTVEYYAEICRRSEQWSRQHNQAGAPLTPDIAIESLDLNRAIALLGQGEDDASWAAFDQYHRAALKRLEAAGAELALIASNTPHQRLEAITSGIGVPVLSIFDASARAAAHAGARRVLILGTRSTMASTKLPAAFARQRIAAAAPQDEAPRALTCELIDELELGAGEAVAARLGHLARSAVDRQFGGDAAVCLACTELPLAFPEAKRMVTFERGGTLYINSTAAHIEAALAAAGVGQDACAISE